MIRYHVIETLMRSVTNERVVCNIGHPCQELYQISDRPENFYMLGSMGMASSIGHGLALSTSERVVVLEGDGAMLMNMGSLATIGATGCRNLILVVIDNSAYGSTGFQESFTAKTADLAGVARACGISRTIRIDRPEEILEEKWNSVLQSEEGPWCVVVKADPGLAGPLEPISLGPENIKQRFMKTITHE